MKIIIVGTGYVGLVTGACMAEVGSQVVCIDVDKTKIENLKKGIMPIYEPGLEELVERNVAKQRLHFSTSLSGHIHGATAIFIAVGTPPDEDGSADLKYVIAVAEEIGSHLDDYCVIITKSTVPVGTAGKVRTAIQSSLQKRNKDIAFDIASNPEFLKEGAAIDDFMRPDRIVIGVDTQRAKTVLDQLYQPFVLNGHPVMFMDVTSAELTKYAANAMLATRISFMNEIANLCEKVGADVNEVRKGIGSDPRIGSKFLYSGVGYGGSCFPKDVQALVKTGIAQDSPLRILEAVELVNNDQKKILFSKIQQHFGGNLQGKKIAVWGLAFKPNTDDMREAPSLVLIEQLKEAGADISAFDPIAIERTQEIIGAHAITWAEDIYHAVEDADAIALVTEWNEFRMPNFEKVKSLMKTPVIFDGRNIYNPATLQSLGFTYYGIGVK